MADNRASEANGIPLRMPIPSGTIADLDGSEVRALLAARGGRAGIRIGRESVQHEVGRSGVVTSFSSGGPTAFGHVLKPDVGAPGAPSFLDAPAFGGPFAVFDGTSMAAPHVAGAAALLLERHPNWSPRTVKSALVSTAGPAWADTARTQVASVLLSGSGLVNVQAADAPSRRHRPGLALLRRPERARRRSPRRPPARDLRRGRRRGHVDAAGSASGRDRGTGLEVPGSVTIPPSGNVQIGVAATASATAQAGDNYGFLLLAAAPSCARSPTRSSSPAPASPRSRRSSSDASRSATRHARFSNVSVYRFPALPFGPPPDYVGKPMDEKGAETLDVMRVNNPVANAGVAVIAASQRRSRPPVAARLARRERRPGYSGTPVNVNALTFGYHADIGAAGLLFPRRGRYFVAVDSGSDEYTGRSFAGSYVLRAWQNDVRPPRVRLDDAHRCRTLARGGACHGSRRRRRSHLARDRHTGACSSAPRRTTPCRASRFPDPGQRRPRSGPAARTRSSWHRTSRRRRTSTRPARTSCRTPASNRSASGSSKGRRSRGSRPLRARALVAARGCSWPRARRPASARCGSTTGSAASRPCAVAWLACTRRRGGPGALRPAGMPCAQSCSTGRGGRCPSSVCCGSAGARPEQGSAPDPARPSGSSRYGRPLTSAKSRVFGPSGGAPRPGRSGCGAGSAR